MIKYTSSMFEFNDGINEFYVPGHMISGLIEYIEHRIEQGSFLHAVLCNDLMEACRRADYRNIRNLPAYAFFLDNHAPPECYGSKKKVERWLKKDDQVQDKRQ